MAYEKQTWQCGDTVTAEKLNHMEDGIVNASENEIMYFGLTTQDGVNWTSDATYTEIKQAINGGVLPVVVVNMPGRGKYYSPLTADFSDYVYFNLVFVTHTTTESGVIGTLTSANVSIHSSGEVRLDMQQFALASA